MRKLIIASAASVLLATSVAACTKGTASPGASASAAADKQQAEKYVSNCVPADSLAQVQLAKQLATDPDARAKLAACLGIPQDQRQAFEGAALGDAEHVHWSDKSARSTFFSATLPQLAEQYHAKP